MPRAPGAVHGKLRGWREACYTGGISRRPFFQDRDPHGQLQKHQHYDDDDYPAKRRWIAEHLLDLRDSLRAQIRDGRTPGSLSIGSWNIRAFDDGRPRLDEGFHYIAEIIDQFDICAIQEIKRDLAPLERLMRLLAPSWAYFVTDITEGAPGNRERMAVLYNRNRVRFRNLIGELVLPREMLIADNQIARSPFFAAFQAGWFRFTLCSTHIFYAGTAAEIGTIAGLLSARAAAEDEVYILLGDMNIDARDDGIMAALTGAGFKAPDLGPTNLAKTKFYDQIAFSTVHGKTRLLRAGALDWRDAVYREDEATHYRPHAERLRGEAYADWSRRYANWTTFEMSDHLPVWVALEVDYSDDYLARLAAL